MPARIWVFALAMLTRALILLLLAAAIHQQCHSQSLALRGGVQVDLIIDPLQSATATVASTKLMWRKLRRPSKVMVSTSSPGHRFDLTVTAENVKWAEAVGTVSLVDGMPATEIIVNAGRKQNGHCTLRYTAFATPVQGIGQDIHTVTYTLTEQ